EVAFSPDGKLLAIGNVNGPTRINDVATGEVLHLLPPTHSHEIKFSPDGKILAVAYDDGSVRLWDVSGGTLLNGQATGTRTPFALNWPPAGDVLVTAGLGGAITLWSPDLSVLRKLPAPERVLCVRFSPDGRRLFSAGGAFMGSAKREVQVWGVPARDP